jgi:hypothetical protein
MREGMFPNSSVYEGPGTVSNQVPVSRIYCCHITNYDVSCISPSVSPQGPCTRHGGEVFIGRVSDAAHRDRWRWSSLTMNPKGSHRARRCDDGEQTGAWETRGARQGGRWPLPKRPSDEFGGCPLPRTARHEGGRREGGPAALTRAVPSEDLDSRQRSREVRRTQCEVTGRLLQVKRPERLARLGPFRFPPTRSRTSPGTRPEPPPSVVLASVGQASGGRSSRNSR